MFARFDEHDKHEELNSNSKGKVEDINEVIFVTLDKRQSCNYYHILGTANKNLIASFFMLNPTEYEFQRVIILSKSISTVLKIAWPTHHNYFKE